MEIQKLGTWEGYKVVLVRGKGTFDLQKLLQKLQVSVTRYSIIRSHVFQEDEKYIAVVLLPKRNFREPILYLERSI